MPRLTKFIRQPIHRKILFVEAFFRLCYAWVIVRKIGFTKRAAYLGTKYPGDWSEDCPSDLDKAEDIRWAINGVNILMRGKFTCLMIALAGKAMLRRFDIPNALVMGATRSTEEGNTEMLAHAWLRSGSKVILGEHRMEEYTPIVSYVDGPKAAPNENMAPRGSAEP